nr:helix-turn-helix transcriptional regulator [Phenylobacterium aquaticum]
MSHVLRAIRNVRRLRVVDVAEAMGMAPRSYEHFEAGRGRLDFLRLERFAEATGSDPGPSSWR